MSTFELMSSKDLAYQMTMFDWELFSCMHEVVPPPSPPPPRLNINMRKVSAHYAAEAAARSNPGNNLPAFPSPARAAVSHVRPAELQENHGQPGPVPAPVQPGPAVGGHRGLPVQPAQQESAAPQEVHQDSRTVSGQHAAGPPGRTRSIT